MTEKELKPILTTLCLSLAEMPQTPPWTRGQVLVQPNQAQPNNQRSGPQPLLCR